MDHGLVDGMSLGGGRGGCLSVRINSILIYDISENPLLKNIFEAAVLRKIYFCPAF